MTAWPLPEPTGSRCCSCVTRAWATEASIWLNHRGQLKRAFEREQVAVRAAEARAAVLKRRGVGDGNDQPAKRLRVRSAQVAKAKYPGSLTVTPGETCIFVEVCNNPMWSRVKMDDDGRMGLVSASRLEELPEEAPLPDPSDDEQMPDPSDDDTDAHEEARITTADDAQAEAIEEEAFVERGRVAEAARAAAEAAQQAAAAEECGYGGD